MEIASARLSALPVRQPRVLVIGSTFGSYGGIEAFMIETARRVAASGRFAVRVVFKLVGGARPAASLQEALEPTGLKVRFVRSGSWAVLREVAAADLIHAQNAPPDVCLPAALLGKPLILSVHNRFMGQGSARGWLWKWGRERATQCLFNSKFVQNSWGHSATDSRSRVVHTASELASNPAPFEGRRGFCFIGRLIENKGADLLLAAYQNAQLDPQHWPLTFIGEGPLREALAEKVRAAGGQTHIRLTGFIPSTEKFALLRSAKWLVAPPNTGEDMGLTPLEARSQAIPCIVSDDGGLPEVGGTDALVCRRGEVADLTRALLEAAAMPEPEYRARALRSFTSLAQALPEEGFYADVYTAALRDSKARGTRERSLTPLSR